MPGTHRVLIATSLALAAILLALRFSSDTSNISTESLFASAFVDPSGISQPLAQWRGKVLVVNFWASWCPPCREEMPALNQLQRQYAAKGLQLVGISTENINIIKNTKADYPLLAADDQAMPLAASLGNHRSVLPFTVVLDRHGKIVKIIQGKVDISTLEKAVTPLL